MLFPTFNGLCMLPASWFSKILHLDSILLAVQFVGLNKCAYEFCWCFAGYIKNFKVTDPHRVGKINVELHGRIKDCKALTYRQDLRAKEIEQYRVRMLPTRQVYFIGFLEKVLQSQFQFWLGSWAKAHNLIMSCQTTNWYGCLLYMLFLILHAICYPVCLVCI